MVKVICFLGHGRYCDHLSSRNVSRRIVRVFLCVALCTFQSVCHLQNDGLKNREVQCISELIWVNPLKCKLQVSSLLIRALVDDWVITFCRIRVLRRCVCAVRACVSCDGNYGILFFSFTCKPIPYPDCTFILSIGSDNLMGKPSVCAVCPAVWCETEKTNLLYPLVKQTRVQEQVTFLIQPNLQSSFHEKLGQFRYL